MQNNARLSWQSPWEPFYVALCYCFAAHFSVSAALADVSGSYFAEGRNPDGSTYTGDVRIVQEDGYASVSWRVGSQSYQGQGPINGDVITVDWGDAHPVIYVVMPDGELHGTWADGKALEKLTPR